MNWGGLGGGLVWSWECLLGQGGFLCIALNEKCCISTDKYGSTFGSGLMCGAALTVNRKM